MIFDTELYRTIWELLKVGILIKKKAVLKLLGKFGRMCVSACLNDSIFLAILSSLV